MKTLYWAVCYDIDGKNYDDGKTRVITVAAFHDPFAAQDFIDKCLPTENHDRFYIKNLMQSPVGQVVQVIDV